MEHANGLTDTIERDPDWMQRPASLATALGSSSPLWTSGPFSYDAAGKITAMGGDKFFYDEVSRLTKAEVKLGTATTTETYSYDRFGNLISIGSRINTIDQRTNRLDDLGYSYDLSCSLKS
ncbi:MAG: hypothetical protein K0U98_02235 [Deltaproteobacteria bacterium]|nr:hypothetical protein [Deltaproteobacteria bacterium]